MLGANTVGQQVRTGQPQVDGSVSKVAEFIALIDTFEFWFPIVTPRA